jgi:hypothetical protein
MAVAVAVAVAVAAAVETAGKSILLFLSKRPPIGWPFFCLNRPRVVRLIRASDPFARLVDEALDCDQLTFLLDWFPDLDPESLHEEHVCVSLQ